MYVRSWEVSRTDRLLVTKQCSFSLCLSSIANTRWLVRALVLSWSKCFDAHAAYSISFVFENLWGVLVSLACKQQFILPLCFLCLFVMGLGCSELKLIAFLIFCYPCRNASSLMCWLLTPVCYGRGRSAAWLTGQNAGLWQADFSQSTPDLWLTCDHFVHGKETTMGQPTRPTQPSIPSGSVNE